MMGGGFFGGWHRGRQDRPTRITRAMLLRITRYFEPYWREGVLVITIVAVVAGIGLVPALLIRAVVDVAIPQADPLLLAYLALGMVAAPAAGGLLGVAQTYLNAQISQRVMFDLRNQLYVHLQSLSLRFFTGVKTGEVMSRLNNDVSGISRVVNETITQSLMQPLLLISTVILMLGMEWRLALLSLVVVPVALGSARRVGERRFELQHEAQRKQADLSAIMQETLNISGFLLMKAFAREAYEQVRFVGKNRELMDVQVRSNMLGRWLRMLLQVMEALGPALIYLVGGHLVLSGQMTLGTLIAFIALLNRLYGPMSQLANIHVEAMGSLALFERIFEYLDTQPDVADAIDARPIPAPVRGHIVFHEVDFEYVPGRRVLDGVSFEVEPGQLVALVGPSGAGKTTVTYLIPRFYDVTGGRVEIDGKDVRKVTLRSLREHVGVVTQETYLFNATVRENLRYARPGATDEEIERACVAARLDDVIAQMPDGFDTPVGERGYRLSGGEKQRLAIARVLLKDPRMLVLDEATSSLDSQTEAQIQSALGPLITGRTTIAIAHRLSTVLAADTLVVFDRGHVVEVGNHAQLIDRGGLYAQLYNIQFKPQLTGARPSLASPTADGLTERSSDPASRDQGLAASTV
ncbi:MAG: ATP-binding cassette domain-containing protein [Chloroflexi bacterium]|nr:ATP-binding cassette domain-containing protein [Chloroflexota bacterium]